MLRRDGKEPRDPAHGKSGVWTVTPQPEMLFRDCSSECSTTLSSLEPGQAGSRGGYTLALIVVRLDPHEGTDTVGAYQIVLDAAR